MPFGKKWFQMMQLKITLQNNELLYIIKYENFFSIFGKEFFFTAGNVPA
jgi:hypothetical protein